MSKEHPDTVSVTQRIEREEFARGHIGPGDAPALPRPAATIILARENPRGFEVLLLRRPDTTRFAAGAYVFAGGVIDEADGAPFVIDRFRAASASAEGQAMVAALRELFEETGFLLADVVPSWSELEPVRDALLRGERTFADVVEQFDLTFDQARVAYTSRWITPERFARRYDTRFFLAAAAVGQPRLTDELAGHIWITPREAVRRFRAGTLPMLFPTRVTLERLAAEPDLESVFTAAESAVIEPIMPRLLVEGAVVRPVLPGDAGFEEAGR